MARPNTMRLSRRDVARIKALAEQVAAAGGGEIPAALGDLDAPWRVAALPPEAAARTSGEAFGTWAGMTLVAWWRGPLSALTRDGP